MNSPRQRLLLLLLLIASLVVLAIVAPLQEWSQALLKAHLWRSPQGVVLFLLLYMVWNFAFPPAPLQILAGMHFGFLPGLILIALGTSLANIISHAMGRWLGRTWVVSRAEESARLKSLEHALKSSGWRAVVLLRLSNLIPSNLANLLMGATPLKLSTILWASLLGSLPGWVVTLLLGQGANELLEGNGYTRWTFYLVGMALAVICLGIIGRRAMRLLRAKGEEAPL